jgi:uroporphyrin-III C-methyltransferase
VSARPDDGFVSFVGAGPGDPELITLKALRRIREADVVIHDRLVPIELLDEARADAEIIDVGKAPGRACPRQGQINQIIVDHALDGRRVVRLKGGDPSIFGRLAEEIRAVRDAGVALEVVPGVTAATAAAAVAGISLTERGEASTLIFATGSDHAQRPLPDHDWDLLARAAGTLVFYMPLGALDRIVGALTSCGRDPDEPAMLVEAIGTGRQRVVASGLGGIVAAGREAAIGSPAILVTGPTVAAATAEPRLLDALARMIG